jgi:myo-inositol-1(or 4)-monophosphatase
LPAADAAQAGLAERLAAVLREAGATAMRTFRAPVRRWTKKDSSPVCEADVAVNSLLHQRLPAMAPDAAWLSEETEDDARRLSARRLWVVDPIDGTRAYLEGLDDWTISVALVADGRPVTAGVFAPVEDRLYLAVAGGGATVNGQPIEASRGRDLAGRRVAGPKRHLESLARLGSGIVPVPKVHSLALRLVRVASGELDAASASANSHDWDLAAADLLVHEAGGALTTFAGDLLAYNEAHAVHRPLLAAGRLRHAALIDLVRARAADFV